MKYLQSQRFVLIIEKTMPKNLHYTPNEQTISEKLLAQFFLKK